MANQATIKRAARYGVRTLQAQLTDMSPGSAYSREMINDMELAIAMLKAMPALIDAAQHMLSYFEAGPEPDEPGLRNAVRKADRALQLALDRKQAELL